MIGRHIIILVAPIVSGLVSNVAAFSMSTTGIDSGSPPAIKAGDKLPFGELDFGFPPQKVTLPSYLSNRKVLIVGLPGAFTPTWSEKQIPGYIENQDALIDAGIEEVLIYSVNDGAVMRAWFLDQNLNGTIMQMMGDPSGEFTRNCGMELTHPGPQKKGLYGRCKRFVMYVKNLVVQYVAVSESEDDPAGDEFPEMTCAPAVIDIIKNQS